MLRPPSRLASHLWGEFGRSRQRPGASAAYCSCFPSKTKGPCSRRERVAWLGGVLAVFIVLGGGCVKCKYTKSSQAWQLYPPRGSSSESSIEFPRPWQPTETNGRQPIHSEVACNGPIDRGGARGRPELVEGGGPEKRKGARVIGKPILEAAAGPSRRERANTHKNMPAPYLRCRLLRSDPRGGIECMNPAYGRPRQDSQMH